MLVAVLGLVAAQLGGRTPGAEGRSPAGATRVASFARVPLAFEAVGDARAPHAGFQARGHGYSLSLRPTEAVIALEHAAANSGLARSARLRMRLEGGNPAATVRAEQPLPGRVNYLLGNDPKKWRTNVPTCAAVRCEEVYPGIDLVYYGNQRQLEYDFVVRPNGRPESISLGFEGATDIEIARNGDLEVRAGDRDLTLQAPVIYQEADGVRRSVEGRYVLDESAPGASAARVGFATGPYDASRPLVIDPVLVYASYSGGSNWDEAMDVAIDAAGNAYFTGRTASPQYPTTAGAPQGATANVENFKDGFVTKVNAAGALVYSTYLGGSDLDYPYGIGVDASGNAYVTGITASPNFPLQNAFQNTRRGTQDAFLTKLNATGTGFVYSTYLGGGSADYGQDVAIGSDGSAYVVGWTSSNAASGHFPLANAYQATPRGELEGFVCRMDAAGSALIFSTYLGGLVNDAPMAVALDAQGDACVVGYTQSTNFPLLNPYQAALRMDSYPSQDGFLSRFQADGTLVHSTYLGGASVDAITGVAVDSAGRAIVAGNTHSPDFPVTAGAFQTTRPGYKDAFVTRFALSGTTLDWSTYLGGSESESSTGEIQVGVDALGVVTVGGNSYTDSNFPITIGSLRSGGAFIDAFITSLTPDGDALVYSSWLGGSSGADITGLAVHPGGDVFVTGVTSSLRTWNPFQATNGGNPDGFIARLTYQDAPASPTSLTSVSASNTQVRLNWVDNSTNETHFEVERTNTINSEGTPINFAVIGTPTANVTTYLDSGLATNSNYYYRVIASNGRCLSLYSNRILGRPLPNVPSGLTATPVNAARVDLAWTENTPNFSAHRIERSTDGTNWAEVGSITRNESALNGARYSDLSVAANRTYQYRVRAFHSLGTTDPSNVATVLTHPADPSGLALSVVSASQLDLSWTDGNTPPTESRVERSTDGTSFTEVATVAAGLTAYPDTGRGGNTTYHYRVRSRNATGNSGYTAVKTGLTVPSVPAALMVAASSQSRLDLSWTDTNLAPAEHRVEHSTDGSNFTDLTVVPAGTTTYAHTGLATQSTHHYRVRAANASGVSAYSSIAMGTTLANPPLPPDGLTATLGGPTRVDLAWVDRSSDETGFKIERKAAGGSFELIASVAAGITSYPDTGVVDSTTYTYRVRAHISESYSAYSDPAVIEVPLASPANLVLDQITASQVRLTWTDRSAAETGFKIERSTGSGFTPRETVAANLTSFTDTGLASNTTYSYRVLTLRDAAQSAPSNEAGALTLPAAPAGLEVTVASSTQLDLLWSDENPSPAEHRIERSSDGGSNFTEVKVAAAGTSAWSDGALTPDTTYRYRVRAVNGTGFSGYSDVAMGTTLPAPPAAPTGLNAVIAGSHRVNLTWTDQSSNETGFEIERQVDGGDFGQIATVGSGATSFGDTDLPDGTTYRYRVRAYNAGGRSEFAGPVTAPLPLAAPTGLMLVRTPSQIQLTWVDSSAVETGFKVERSSGGGFGARATVAAGVTEYTDTSLAGNTTYTYRVRTLRDVEESAPSNEGSALTFPATPSGLGATVLSSVRIDLAWTDENPNPAEHRLERSVNGSDNFTLIALLPPGTLRYSDTVSPLTTYFYRVRATNSAGSSGYSGMVSGETPPNPPAAPTNLAVTRAAPSQVNLSWQDNSSNESGFRIERRTGSGAFALIATVGANVRAYNNNGLALDTDYGYRVRAFNAGGESAPAGPVTIATPPAAPFNLVLGQITAAQIRLDWASSSTTETGFSVERKTEAGAFAAVGSVGADATTYTDTTVAANTTYTYRVRAASAAGDSEYSNAPSALTLPAAPTNLTVLAAVSEALDVSWTDGNTPPAAHQVERSSDGGTTFSQVAMLPAGTTTYRDSPVSAALSYGYRVRAVNATGSSPFTAVVNRTPLPPAPAAPTGFQAVLLSGTEIRLTWTDAATNEQGFQVERKVGTGPFTLRNSPGPDATSYTDPGV
ncbi:MAG: repeat-containing protein, partial [Armatimonadetes bacterium]|nr:repeat-containing protein [Armatimonadota bacterium]